MIATVQNTGASTILHVVGLGPGSAELLAPLALEALRSCSVIVGYKGYVDLLAPTLLKGKTVVATGMTGEQERVHEAITHALAGRETCLVCSGDPGIYAMAGLVLEMMEERGLTMNELMTHIVPGIPAVCAAAALLGAPLMHDFACISLSDLLTPWPRIRRRLDAAFAADFVVALYNPRSKCRTEQLIEAIQCALTHKVAVTPVGVIRNAYREGQQVSITTLGAFDPEQVDMFTIVIIGNSETRIVPASGPDPLSWSAGARLLTPRGYARKYDLRSRTS